MEPRLLAGRAITLGNIQGLSVLFDQISSMLAAIILFQRTDDEIANIERPMAFAHHAPIEESDITIRQRVGVANMGITMEKGRMTSVHEFRLARPELDH